MTAKNFSKLTIAFFALIAITMIVGTASAQSSSQYNPQQVARIDVCFLLDSTGSMADEIQVVKDKIWEIVNEILLGDPKPDVRFSIVTYRDHGDAYVVQKYPFTRDVDRVHSDLMSIQADAGGDKREDVNEGFRTAIHDLDWDKAAGISRMIFLIGDAGPHMDYEQTVPYAETAKLASELGVQVFSIGCSGIDSAEIKEFTEIANLTGGMFEFLTYKMDVEQDGESKTLLITGAGAAMAPSATLEDSEWKKGSDELRSEGKVSVADKMEKVKYKDDSGAEVERDVEELTNSSATQSMENNLDSVIRKQIQIQAEMQGAKYDNSELDVKVEIKTVTKKKVPWYTATWNWIVSLFD